MNEKSTIGQLCDQRLTRKDALKAAALVGAGSAALTTLAGVQSADASMMMCTPKSMRLSNLMRRLWEEHITWTRLYIVSFAAGLPDAQPTAARLLRNQVDIGNAIKPYYGQAAGNKLTHLLKQHILGAVDILKAAKSGNSAKEKEAVTAWYANADQIAAFLHQANPHHWSLSAMKRMMHRHLSLTLTEASHRLHGNYSADIADYDRVETEILSMADMLTSGIVAQFPSRFR